MTTIFHTTEILDHTQNEYPHPDLESELLKIFERTEHELSYLEFSTDEDDEAEFNKRYGNVESELSELKDIAKGSELYDYKNYVTQLEALVVTLTDSLISVGKRADTLSKAILSVDNKMDRAEISDEFLYLSGEAVREFNTDSSLYSALESRGWNKFQRGFVFNIIQEERTGYAGSIVVELMLHGSTANNMVVGVQDWITLCGKTLCLCDGDDTLRIDAVNGSIDIILTKDKKVSRFRLSEMKDLFMDVMNPTDEEILMYKMSHHAEYDICGWRETFGTKPK